MEGENKRHFNADIQLHMKSFKVLSIGKGLSWSVGDSSKNGAVSQLLTIAARFPRTLNNMSSSESC